MDLVGAVGTDELVDASSITGGRLLSSHLASDSHLPKENGPLGSDFLKQRRSGAPVQHDWRCLKMARTEDPQFFPSGERMLSFSSSKLESLLLSGHGFYCGSLDVSRDGVLAGAKAPFTPSQWMELERQALIYKYIHAKAPIPENLLSSLGKFLLPSGFSALSSGSFRTTALEWGSFHLGFPGNADPEPGRCRRTDGKKWRCSRDAVTDQKYCERHMNRGRHRSRKPVEGHVLCAAKMMPAMAPSPPASAGSCRSSSSNLAESQQQTHKVEPVNSKPTTTEYHRMLACKKVNPCIQQADLSALTLAKSEPTNNLYPIPEQYRSDKSSSQINYGNSFHSPSSSYTENVATLSSLQDTKQEPRPHPFNYFSFNVQKLQSESFGITWPEKEEMMSDRTKLSISNPPPNSDVSSCSSSPAFSPLKLFRDGDPTYAALETEGLSNIGSERQMNWLPTTGYNTVGGPLGEALKNTGNALHDCNKPLSMDRLMDNWDLNSRTNSSPTGN